MDNKEFTKILKLNKGRFTKGKEALIDLFSDESAVYSMAQIQSMLSGKLNPSTIYRNIDNFVQIGYIKKINIDGELYYTKMPEGHKHYVICEKCHKKEELDFCPAENIPNRVSDYQIIDHEFELIGICDECRKTNK